MTLLTKTHLKKANKAGLLFIRKNDKPREKLGTASYIFTIFDLLFSNGNTRPKTSVPRLLGRAFAGRFFQRSRLPLARDGLRVLYQIFALS